MAKFKVGDKVRHVDDGQDGPVGVVKGVYGDGKIKVKFPGLMKDGFDGFEEEELVMANGCARNAKFKVGDKVTDGNAVYVITDVDDGIYEWKFVSGKADPSHSEGGEIAWAEGKMHLANSARNAKFRLGDRVEFRGVKGTVKRVVEGRDGMPTSYKIKGDDGEVYTPSEWDVKYVGNSASLASTNAVVQNAINARRARNAKAEFVQPYVRGDVTDNGVSIRLIKLQDEIKDATADGCAAKAFQQVKLLREVANSLEKVAKWMGSLA